LYFSARSSAKMEKYERLLPKGTSFAKVDKVWRARYEEVKTYVFWTNAFSNTLWGHPTSLLAAPSRAPLNTHTSNCAALFSLPTKQLRNAISSPFQVPNQTVTQRYKQPFSGSQPNIYTKLSAALFRAPRYRISLFWPITGQSVLTNHRQHTNPGNRIKGDRVGLVKPPPPAAGNSGPPRAGWHMRL